MKNKILIIVIGFSCLQFSNVLSADLKHANEDMDIKRRTEVPPLFGQGGLSETIKNLQNALSKAQKAQQDGKKDDSEKYLYDAQDQMYKLSEIDQEAIAQKIKNTKHFREFLIQHGLLDKKFLDSGNDAAADDVEGKFASLQKQLGDLWLAMAPIPGFFPEPGIVIPQPQKPEPAIELVLFGKGSLSEAIKGIQESLSKAETARNVNDFEKYKKDAENHMLDFQNLLPKDREAFENKLKNTAHLRKFFIQHGFMTNEFLNRTDDEVVQNFMFEMRAIADKFAALKAPVADQQPGPAVQPMPVQPRQPAQPQADVKGLDEYKKRIDILKRFIPTRQFIVQSVKGELIQGLDNILKAINDNSKDLKEKLALFDEFEKALYAKTRPNALSIQRDKYIISDNANDSNLKNDKALMSAVGKFIQQA